MPGDAKTKSRKRKRNDQVERFTESRLALQRAMEKDYRTSRESQRAVEDVRASAQKVEEKDANAERLAALLEAARRQGEAASKETRNSVDAKKAPSINRALARPASYLLTADVRAARARATHPEPAITSAAGTMAPPPLVDRDADIPPDSAGKLIGRLLIVAIIVGVAGYVFVVPKTKEEPVMATGKPAAAPASGPAVSAGRVAAASTDAPGPPAPSATLTVATPTATMSPQRPAETPEPVKTSAEVTPAAPESDAPETNLPEISEIRTPATVSVRAVRQAADIPSPPPPSPIAQPSADVTPARAATPEQTGPELSIGEETLRALSLIETDATSVSGVSAAPTDAASGAAENPPADTKVSADGPATTDGSANGEAVPAGPVSKQQRLVDRRPFFRRLGPTPAPNPFRPGKSEPEPAPPPAPAPAPLFNFPFFDIE